MNNTSMMDQLESRSYFSSTVSLYNTDGSSGAVINRHMALFVLAHGDQMTVDEMTDIAAAVKGQLPATYQVLIADWTEGTSPLTVGSALADTIAASHIPVSRVSLIGYSLGGVVMSQTAKDLKSRTSEVNRIIGIDPASSKLLSADYAKNSAYSIAFCGNDGYAHTASSLSATDTILMTGLNSNDLLRHYDVFQGLTNIWQDDANIASSGDQAVDSLFSINSILNGRPAPWRNNAFYSGFEAIMPCNDNAENPTPLSLLYVNSRGHTVTID